MTAFIVRNSWFTELGLVLVDKADSLELMKQRFYVARGKDWLRENAVHSPDDLIFCEVPIIDLSNIVQKF